MKVILAKVRNVCIFSAIIVALLLSSAIVMTPQEVWAQDVQNADMVVVHPGIATDSYFRTTLTAAEGYDGHHAGWCADRYIFIHQWVHYDVDLYGEYHSLPPHAQGIAWDKVNYILNHKQGSWNDMQQAFWYYSDGVPPSTAIAQAIVADAEAHGTGFIPLPGQIKAVICDAGPTRQLTFVEYELPHTIDINKTGPEAAECLEEVTYQFEVINPGVDAITVASIIDDVVGNITADFVAANGGSNILAATSTVYFTVNYTVSCAPPYVLTNTVTISGSVGAEPVEDSSRHSIIMYFQIAGTVFNDINKSGTYDPGDHVIQNVVVELYQDGGTLVDTSTTDTFGNYFFDELDPGNYTVTVPQGGNEDLYCCYTPTTPTSLPEDMPPCMYQQNFGFTRIVPVGGAAYSVSKTRILAPLLGVIIILILTLGIVTPYLRKFKTPKAG